LPHEQGFAYERLNQQAVDLARSEQRQGFSGRWNTFCVTTPIVLMCGTDHKQSPLFRYVNLADRIPRDYPLRRVKVLIDLVLRSMSAHFDALYAEGGRPSIAPERLLRASLL
jgi:hypothetical protein